jgi:hypothetical protein
MAGIAIGFYFQKREEPRTPPAPVTPPPETK